MKLFFSYIETVFKEPDPTTAWAACEDLTGQLTAKDLTELAGLLASHSQYSKLAEDFDCFSQILVKNRGLLPLVTALRADRADILENISARHINCLLLILQGTDKELAGRARLVLLQLKDTAARQLLCQFAMETRQAIPEIVEIIKEANYSHQNPVQQAYFLFLHDSWDKYIAFDFDFRLLRTYYTGLDKARKKELVRLIRTAGRPELLQAIVSPKAKEQPIAGLPGEEWKTLVEALVEQQCWEQLWDYAKVVAPERGIPLLKKLQQVNWQPAAATADSFYTKVSQLAANCESPFPNQPVGSFNALAGLADKSIEVQLVAFQPEHNLIALGCSDRIIRILRLPTGEQIITLTSLLVTALKLPENFDLKYTFLSLTFSSNGKYLLAQDSWLVPPEEEKKEGFYGGESERRINIYSVEQGVLLHTLVQEKSSYYSNDTFRYPYELVHFREISRHNQQVVIGNHSKIDVYNITTGKIIPKLKVEMPNATIVHYTDDGRKMLWRGWTQKDLSFSKLDKSPTIQNFMPAFRNLLQSFAVSANEKYKAMFYGSYLTSLLELRDKTWQVLATCKVDPLRGKITQSQISPTNRILAALHSRSDWFYQDSTKVRPTSICLWSIPELKLLKSFTSTKNHIGLSFLDGGNLLVTVEGNGLVRFYLPTLLELANIPIEKMSPAHLKFISTQLLTASRPQERYWLACIEALLDWRFRNEIEIEDSNPHFSEFDIEI